VFLCSVELPGEDFGDGGGWVLPGCFVSGGGAVIGGCGAAASSAAALAGRVVYSVLLGSVVGLESGRCHGHPRRKRCDGCVPPLSHILLEKSHFTPHHQQLDVHTVEEARLRIPQLEPRHLHKKSGRRPRQPSPGVRRYDCGSAQALLWTSRRNMQRPISKNKILKGPSSEGVRSAASTEERGYGGGGSRDRTSSAWRRKVLLKFSLHVAGSQPRQRWWLRVRR